MRSRIVRIGNSQGVRIPKPLLEQAGLGDDIEMKVVGQTIVIEAVALARQGWSSAFAEMAAAGDDALLDAAQLDEVESTRFDDEEWEW
ncbi:MAG TPA: AbrB/MazE/SpoVT family DNA-binding domain-containing protein [Trueperaceae bacterium]|nr:AbrB/MazE/SpoVT family DNA-binding domain-containing protein [Trueperaceae bacterium]